MEKPDLPIIKECHCGANAHKYRTRKFINKINKTVFRVFYRCENCWSRIHSNFCPELDNCKTIDVTELKNNLHLFNKID